MSPLRRPATIAARSRGSLAVLIAMLLSAGCGITVFGIGDGEPTPAPTRPLAPVGILPPARDPAIGSTRRAACRSSALADLPPEAGRDGRLIGRADRSRNPRTAPSSRTARGSCPSATRGYYHEYTVPTPGSADRGRPSHRGRRPGRDVLDRRPLRFVRMDRPLIPELHALLAPKGKGVSSRRPTRSMRRSWQRPPTSTVPGSRPCMGP